MFLTFFSVNIYICCVFKRFKIKDQKPEKQGICLANNDRNVVRSDTLKQAILEKIEISG